VPAVPLRHALYFAPFEELSEPSAVVALAVTAEANGWDGVFLWDHVLRPDVERVADVWITLAAVAAATERIRIGPMVTPLTRRRVAPLVRQTVSLDRLSGGRLVMGVGLGVDSGGELSRFGEIVDPRVRAARLDEAADVLARAWSGEPVVHRGEHVTVDDVRFLPRPIQQPLPIWCAARGTALRPVRRAARFQGLFPIEVGVAELTAMLDEVRRVRGSLDGFDVAARVSPADDPAILEVPGVTWALRSFSPDTPAAEILAAASAAPDQ
jgi:alkanesulfonate monooxygenase SsuD/methylene tetrahydromethanopterin reductase-like flavin-dependent oxidoreductase (luciferase family)